MPVLSACKILVTREIVRQCQINMKTVCGVRKFYFRNAKVELLHSKATQNLKCDIVKVGRNGENYYEST